MAAPQTFLFKDDGLVPNNPNFPVLIYPGAIDLAGAKDPAAKIEQVFEKNGWGRDMWRNGIFPFVHYHSMIHEVLGIARGSARVQLGGPQLGKAFYFKPGDVAVLPAGTAHQRLAASDDLLVIGAYPPQGTYNLCRGARSEHEVALETVPKVPMPVSDPVHGESGGLVKLWRAS